MICESLWSMKGPESHSPFPDQDVVTVDGMNNSDYYE